MLAFYQRWSRRLYPLRYMFILQFFVAVAAFGWLVFVATAEQSQRWQLAAVLLAVTALLFWLWATVFRQPLPTLANVGGVLPRLKVKLQYGLQYMLCLIISLLLLATLYLGLRVVKGIILILFFS
ncbi:hypothetical protein [Rheinheimera maricola]|uniref:Uncharacterized protein n=1 Tax=Rheinheimera maricola TaxID=2793282 RepID=A0ABS7X6D2_9GAMM|nr:hypothetical protein [Rheinheimera maricola]MBZ9610680.1 hypothetical protein [Rheinheimera maricola]